MWFATHAAVGSALGARFKRPVWAIVIIAMFSHIILDFLPHWDYPISSRTLQYPVIDFIFAITLVWLIAHKKQHKTACLLGALFATLPDFEGIPEYYGYLSHYFFPSHSIPALHNQSDSWWGVGIQIIVLLLSMSIALKKESSQSG